MSDLSAFSLITIIGLVLSAVFAGFENGMISIRKARLDHAVELGSWTAGLIQRLLSRPSSMLAAVLLGTNLAHTITAVAFNRVFETALDGTQVGEWICTSFRGGKAILLAGVLAIIMLIFGEITPKVWFRQRPFHRCSLLVAPIYLFYLATYPIVMAMTGLVSILHRLFPSRQTGDAFLMREDFRVMLRESEEEGLLTTEGRMLLDNSLGFSQQQVRDLMVPQGQVRALSSDATLQDAIELSRETEISRFPVHEPGKPDKWIGVFACYDAIFMVDHDKWASQVVQPYLRPMTVVSAGSDTNQVLKNSRLSRSPLLIVVDQAGQQQGIITVGDIVKPLFGEVEMQ